MKQWRKVDRSEVGLPKEYVDELIEFLSIPSISSEREYETQMRAACYWLEARLSKLGLAARVMETSFQPVVFAESKEYQDSKPTVMVYGHYDVQGPEPLDRWESQPFVPEIRNNNVYGRGTADDKGQLFTWIVAMQELLKKQDSLPVNVKYLIEGAEEEGSRGLREFVRANKRLLQADVCVISDSHCLSESQPVITYGLRGLSYYDVVVKTLNSDAHSGVYGGNVLNAASVLAKMIAQMKGEDHVVQIPGFYENVRELGEDEKLELARFPFRKENILSETGAVVVAGEVGRSIPERAGARPTLDVNGFWSGYGGEGTKTIVPAEARAKVSMRLVPNQNSREIGKKFEKFFNKITPKGVVVELRERAASEPVLLDRNSTYFRSAEGAYEKVFGKRPKYELSGGSIGVVADFAEILGIDSVMMGYGLPDDNLHGPNEKLSLEMFRKGVLTNMEFLEGLEKNGKAGS